MLALKPCVKINKIFVNHGWTLDVKSTAGESEETSRKLINTAAGVTLQILIDNS